MTFETTTIAGLEVRAYFNIKPFRDTLIKIAFATKSDGVAEFATYFKSEYLQPKSKEDCIRVLEDWIKTREWSSFRSPNELHCNVPRCGHAVIWNLDDCVPFSTINPVDEACKSVDIDDVIGKKIPSWLTESESSQYQRRLENWYLKNPGYLEGKAKETAQFWVDAVGSLGSSGSLMVDFMIAQTRADAMPVTQADLAVLFQVIYGYTLKNLEAGYSCTWLSTDYGPTTEFLKLLEESDLYHLRKHLPIKATFWPSFDDFDRSALLEVNRSN